MPDALSQALAMPGLGWLIGAAFAAGLVRGFTGFGTAMIYMPVAAQVLPPLWAIATMAVMDVIGPVPNIPSALRQANRRHLALLLGGMAILLPGGLWLLSRIPESAFQAGVSLVVLVMLAVLIGGLRYRGVLGDRAVFATGAMSGLLGGVSGMPGPPVILLYMAGPYPERVVRAVMMAYLFFYDVILLGMLVVGAVLTPVLVVAGLVLAVPNTLGNVAGAMLFRPGRERVYRVVAYIAIAGAAVMGLPVWGL